MFACVTDASILASLHRRAKKSSTGFLGVTLEHGDQKSMPCCTWAIAAANVIPGGHALGYMLSLPMSTRRDFTKLAASPLEVCGYLPAESRRRGTS